MGESRVAVVGAGPAGIAAAARAAGAGKAVVLIDEGIAPGGQIWKRGSPAGAPGAARRWLDRLARSGARVESGAAVVLALEGSGPGVRRLVLEDLRDPQRRREVEAETLILATGARERFLPFPGWTLANVLGVGAAQSLLKSGVSFAGRTAVVAGSGPLLLAAAASLAACGARIRIVAEQASGRSIRRFARRLAARPGKLLQAAAYRLRFPAARYLPGVWVAEARGEGRVEEVLLTDGERRWTLSCDLLCCGYGLVPNLEAAFLLGCETRAGGAAVDDLQRSSAPGIFCAGEITGIGGVELALVEGQIAGLAAAGREEEARGLFAERSRLRTFARELASAFALRAELRTLPRPDTVVCRCEDVPLGRINAAWTRRQAKLYTRAGMGPCQGRVCAPALDFLLGGGPDSARPPLRPAQISSFLAETPDGETGEIERRTP